MFGDAGLSAEKRDGTGASNGRLYRITANVIAMGENKRGEIPQEQNWVYFISNSKNFKKVVLLVLVIWAAATSCWCCSYLLSSPSQAEESALILVSELKQSSEYSSRSAGRKRNSYRTGCLLKPGQIEGRSWNATGKTAASKGRPISWYRRKVNRLPNGRRCRIEIL